MFNWGREKTSKFFTWASSIGLMTYIFCINTVSAALPDADGIVPDGMTAGVEEKPIDFLFELGTIVLKGVGVIIGAVVVIGVGIKIWQAFMEAKDAKGGWGTFAIVAVVGVLVATAAVVLVVLGLSYL